MKKAVFISILTVMASATALAHGPRGDRGAHFREADKNGDGQIDQREWTEKTDARFDAMDANGDGKLTKEERKAHFEAKMAARFAEKDANGDGRLTRDEIGRMPDDRFKAIDANGDGALSKEEFAARRGERGHGPHGRMHEACDADGDGVVTKAEHRKHARERFAKMDANDDDVLSRDELGKRHGKRHGKGGHGRGHHGGGRR